MCLTVFHEQYFLSLIILTLFDSMTNYSVKTNVYLKTNLTQIPFEIFQCTHLNNAYNKCIFAEVFVTTMYMHWMHEHNSNIFMVVRQKDSLLNWLHRNLHNFMPFPPAWWALYVLPAIC